MKVKVICLIIAVFFPDISINAQPNRGIQPVRVTDTQGQEVTRYVRSYALLIGAGTYSAGWPPLSGAVEDMRKLKPVLEEQGFVCTVVENPTSAQLKSAFEEFINRYGFDPDTRLLLYFAGHGHTQKQSYGGEMGYIVPVDAPHPGRDPKGFLGKALDMQMMEVYARRIQSKHALFVFDSCFSGSVFAMRASIVPENISYKTANPVRQFITSGSAEEKVPDKSVFANQFVAALQGEGDRNGDGFITGSELGEFLQEKVINYSRSTQHPQYGTIRDPNLDKGDFVFALTKSVQSAPLPPTVKPPSVPSVSVEDLKRKADQEEQVQLAWVTRLNTMKSLYNKAKQFEDRESATPGDKEEFWRRFIDAYGEDNPYSREDNAMLADASARRANWGKVKQQYQQQPVQKPSATVADIAGIVMVSIPGGTFSMGSTTVGSDARPVHTVTVSGFEMGKYEVTQGQYQSVMGTNPSRDRGVGDNNPVYYVSWWNAIRFCNALSRRAGLQECYNESTGVCDFSKTGYRLPTEAEWEYACRAGTTTTYNLGNNESDLARTGWYYSNSNTGRDGMTQPVGKKTPNAWGLYDMHGNVWEWCHDWYGSYSGESATNPTGAQSGSYRVLRGGSWAYLAHSCRSAFRYGSTPSDTVNFIGFRVVRRP